MPLFSVSGALQFVRIDESPGEKALAQSRNVWLATREDLGSHKTEKIALAKGAAAKSPSGSVSCACLFGVGTGSAQATQTPAGVRAPRALSTPKVVYPPAGRKRQINGVCSVSAVVDVNGLPTEIRVLRCSGGVFASGLIQLI